MALSDGVGEQLTQTGLGNLQFNIAVLQAASNNLTQGLGVVNTNLIHTHGGTTDDPATIAALNTADRTPVVK